MEIPKKLCRKYLPSLILLAAVIFLFNLEALPVNIMEARNFITAREMLTRENWIFTTLNELPRYEKPPLPTWFTAFSAWIIGIDELFAYRLPAALSAIFLILIFYKFQLFLKVKSSLAFSASVILMTSFYIVFSGRDGQWDIFTHSFMLGCCYFFIKMLRERNHKLLKAVVAGSLFGASLMSKGPVSLYALFLPFLLSYGIVYRLPSLRKNLKLYLIFIVTSLITGSWWTIIVHYYDAAAFTEIATKESSRWFNYNVRPFWYYWSFFTQSGTWTIPAFMGIWYWYLKDRVSDLKTYKFYLFWTLISLLLLSIIPEKKSRYLLPILIPLAMTTAFYVEYVIRNFKTNLSKTEKFPLYLNFGFLSLIGIAAPIVIYYFLKNSIFEMSWSYFSFSFAMVLIGVAMIFGMIKSRIRLLFGLQASMIFIIIIFGLPLAILIKADRNAFNISEIKRIENQENIQIYDASGLLPELIWHYGKPVPLLKPSEEKMELPPKFGVFSAEEDIYWKETLKNYNLKYKGRLDLNPTISPRSNKRLVRDFYIAIRKSL